MTQNISFPNLTRGAQSETDEVIDLGTFTESIPFADSAVFVDVDVWKSAQRAAPFTRIVVEVSSVSSGGVVVNDGTIPSAIGLYGEITGVGKFLLGVLGYNLGAAMPQIIIASNTIGFAQITNYVAIYNKLAIGGIFGSVFFDSELDSISVKVRPIHVRDYGG